MDFLCSQNKTKVEFPDAEEETIIQKNVINIGINQKWKQNKNSEKQSLKLKLKILLLLNFGAATAFWASQFCLIDDHKCAILHANCLWLSKGQLAIKKSRPYLLSDWCQQVGWSTWQSLKSYC